MMDGYGIHGWGMGWWWIISIIIVVAIVWMVVKTMNKSSHTNASSGNSPMGILNKRYAKGEIDKEELEERRKDLF